jgi:hypothetical protein
LITFSGVFREKDVNHVLFVFTKLSCDYDGAYEPIEGRFRSLRRGELRELIDERDRRKARERRAHLRWFRKLERKQRKAILRVRA